MRVDIQLWNYPIGNLSVSTSNDPSEAARLHFESIPWSAALLAPSDVVTFSPPSYSPPDPAGRSISKDELFRNTLNRADAVPACIGFYHRPSGSSNTETTRLLLDSATLLFDLQPGVNGFQGTVHGGFFAALVDEAMGSYIYLSYRLQTDAKTHGSLPENVMDLDNVNFVTAGLNMKLKKPLPTPQVVTVTSTLAELSGRKLVLHTVIEGEGGVQYAACDGTWIAVPRQRL
ncbi:hypothetical protein NM208_g5102 [Fusarium decemcellulare]|uniref:Uncharacterized protein n=1 Tax=Fusarium decemcellulare TaxID=57161 RepID=A0ACC1SID1_9HYPO|nr:hypothetical protein NM208_g5102 [Fusarium decemcellulare]